MPSRRAFALRRGPGLRRLGSSLIAAAVLSPAAALAAPSDLYYERAVMSAANQHCGLFTPELSAALDSAQAQARGAALRAGASSASLEQVRQTAWSRAFGVSCASRDIAVAAARVRTAFDGYARLQKMSFPGDLSDWRADRTEAERTMTWRLAQSQSFGADSLILGLAGQGGASGFVAVVSFADGAQPYAARLVLRDPRRAGQPCLGGPGGGLAARMPLPGARGAYLAEARSTADMSLLPRGAKTGLAFRFPRAAADAMAALDPREAVAVEFLFNGRGGDSVRTAYVEVGDFAAGRAFLVAGQR